MSLSKLSLVYHYS